MCALRIPHPEPLVHDGEHHRQITQGCQVQRFVEGADVRRAVTHLANDDLRSALAHDRQRCARRERELSAHDALAAHQTLVGVEQVHGTAAALRDPVFSPEQLNHDWRGGS